MTILVTGGAGYIGSNTSVALLEEGYDIVIVDDLSNGKMKNINDIKKITGKDFPFYKLDVKDESALEQVFKKHDVDAIIHFAGYKAVGESVEKPLKYYHNNIMTTITLLELCKQYQVYKFIFSSSATVYGDQEPPFKETMELGKTTNPYGESKRINERILEDLSKADGRFEITALRYFNPIECHESGLLKDDPEGIPNNLFPYIERVAQGKLDKLYIYGNDYPTKDGTGVRDYIHVTDLAKGHVAALSHSKQGFEVYNLGTGKGISVLELIKYYENKHHVKIPYEFTDRRPGDIAEAWSDITKSNNSLFFNNHYNFC